MQTESIDRRLSPRLKIAECIRVRPNDREHPGTVCATANQSKSGLYFMIANGTFFPGMPVFVARNFRPEDPAAREERAVVVRVDSLGSGHVGVAVQRTDLPPRRVLFVCVGNACRSPMAEALARHFASDVMVPLSAGLAPLGYVSPATVAVLAEIGVSSAGQTSTPLSAQNLGNVDLVINIAGRPIGKALMGTASIESWTVEDPFGCDISVYRKTRDEIKRRVLELAERLRGPVGARR